MSDAPAASPGQSSVRTRGVGPETGGVMLIIAGVAFVLERFGMLFFLGDGDTAEVWRWIPLFVVYLGARDLRDPAPGEKRSILLLFGGIWLLISSLEVFGLNFLTSWPLLVVFVGLGLIIDSIIQGEPGSENEPGGALPQGD